MLSLFTEVHLSCKRIGVIFKLSYCLNKTTFHKNKFQYAPFVALDCVGMPPTPLPSLYNVDFTCTYILYYLLILPVPRDFNILYLLT